MSHTWEIEADSISQRRKDKGQAWSREEYDLTEAEKQVCKNKAMTQIWALKLVKASQCQELRIRGAVTESLA